MDGLRSSVAREIGLIWETGSQYRLRFRRNLLDEIKPVVTGGDFWKQFCRQLRNSHDDSARVEWEGDGEGEAGGGR